MPFPFIDYDDCTKSPFVQYLEYIITHQPHTLRAKVAADSLEVQHPKYFFPDLLRYGCQSGMARDLVYYTDTRQFYDDYYHEIETLRQEWEENTGESPIPKQCGDLKNALAWFGYEETARRIYEEFHEG